MTDKVCMKTWTTFLALSFLLIISSCGPDKLRAKSASSRQSSSLSETQSCSCTSSYSPVCGADGTDYDNSCLAQCFGTTVTKVGNCDCASNSIKVCGSDGADHTQCEAEKLKIQIVKFVPCKSSEI